MPRTKLDKLPMSPAAHQKKVNKAIESAMVRNDLNQAKLGKMMNMTQQTVSHRMTGETKTGWSAYEILKLNFLLKFTPDELKSITGGITA